MLGGRGGGRLPLRRDAQRLERGSDGGLQHLRRLKAVEQLADLELEQHARHLGGVGHLLHPT